MIDVIALFDIGKTNKKMLLFTEDLSLVFQQEQVFAEIIDDDGYACDDIEKLENWIIESVNHIQREAIYNIKAINFTTYGATLAYLDEKGKRLTPIYNYLKPMPVGVLDGFYEKYGGVEEFSRETASPALQMLNSGLQILWLKTKKPAIFTKVKHILHLPQYLSYLLTGRICSEYTSIGCHTAMWNFDNNQYHRWITDEKIQLPQPETNFVLHPVVLNGKEVKVGSGLHDSSASLVPYLEASKGRFLLISTGTWGIFMNPFNEEKLTRKQLENDTLCFLSIQQKQVKSSRLFMGHIHKVNAEKIAQHFNQPNDSYKTIKADERILEKCLHRNGGKNLFFDEMSHDYISTANLSQFDDFSQAYHQLIIDLARLSIDKMQLIISQENDFEAIYITGGFARNDIFTRLIATMYPDKKVYTSQIDNATALGATLVTSAALGNSTANIDLGLKEVRPFRIQFN